MRIGTNKRPFYRIVAVDERKKRTGGYLELLGTYNPLTEPKEIKLEQAKIDAWIKKGAQPSYGFLRIIGKAPQRAPRKAKKAPKEAAPPAVSPQPSAPEEAPSVPMEEAATEIQNNSESSEKPEDQATGGSETSETPSSDQADTADAPSSSETEIQPEETKT